jgi:curved DNA-binding protein CbpA
MTQPSTPKDLLGTLREIFFERRTGILTTGIAGAERRLYFVQGQMHLPEGHPLARQVEDLLHGERSFGTQEVPVLAEDPATAEVMVLWPPRARRTLRELLHRIANFLAQLRRETGRFDEGREGFPRSLVGPLPTVDLLMELAVVERDDEALLRYLGGEAVRWLVNDERSQPQELWLEPSEGFLLSRLEEPMTAADLVRQMGVPRRAVLEDLCRLRSLELIAPAEEVRKRKQRTTGTTLTVSARELFLERIARDLQQHPFVLEPEEHRAQLAELLRRLGELSFYELLQVRPSANDEEIHRGYEMRARLVHPRHAKALGLEDREEVMDLLFERVTEAYSTLSDPQRRSAYNQEHGIQVFEDEPEVERRNRNRQRSREHFETAQRRFAKEDYHNAYVLLREALRLDAQAEYYALLGQVEMKNPNWQRYAIDTFRKAVDMDPESIEFRYLLADGCEQVGMAEEAKLNYQDILERQPSHASAKEALDRLRGKAPQEAGKKKKGFLGRLFGGDEDAS